MGPQLLSSLWESVIKGDIRGRNKCGEDRKGKSEVGKREYKGLFVSNTVFYVVGLNWCLLNERKNRGSGRTGGECVGSAGRALWPSGSIPTAVPLLPGFQVPPL